VADVARRLLADSGARLAAEQRIALRVDASVVEFLIAQGGYDPGLGARPMRRAIARWVEAPLAEAVLRGELRRGDAIALVAREGAVAWEPQA
jgi:ATP-dependent Clp protease ATP-binding subunit ClpC